MRPEQWAERHDGLIPNEIAAARGVGRGAMDWRRRTGRYRSIRPGVSAVAGAPRTWKQMVRATAIAAGEGVLVSHATACRLLGGPVKDPGWIDLSGPLTRWVRLQGVVGHRTGTLEDGDAVVIDGIPCTSPLRTVIDLSGTLEVPALGKLVDHFLRTRQVGLEALRDRVARTRPAPGRSVKKLRIVLAARIPGYDPGESPLEARIARVIDRAGLPRPKQQHRVQFDGQRYRIDFAWPDRKLYLEGNGFGFHRLSSDLDRDATRQNELVLAGWTPIEITWRMSDAAIERTIRRFLNTV